MLYNYFNLIIYFCKINVRNQFLYLLNFNIIFLIFYFNKNLKRKLKKIKINKKMQTSSSFRNSQTQINYHFNNNVIKNPSPKASTNNFFYNNTNESPKSNNLNTFSSSKLLNTLNSAGYNYRKFTSINLQTNASKNPSMNSTNSKNSPTSYISCSTLQSGVASYSIPKSRRFKDAYKVSYCESIYSLPEFKRTGVSIGNSSRKNLFDKKLDIPSVHDYVHTSVFEQNLNKKKGYSISNKIKIKVNFLTIKIMKNVKAIKFNEFFEF